MVLMMITNKNPIFVRKSGNQDFGSTSPQPLPPKIGANNATPPNQKKSRRGGGGVILTNRVKRILLI